MQAKQSHDDIQFRLMENEDLDQVLELELAAYPIPWSRAIFEDCFSARYECWVMEVQGVLSAYAITSSVLDEAHLLNICVDQRKARQGFGRILLRHLIAKAIARNCTVFFLEVRMSNKAAIELYFTEGFCEVGLRPGYYPTLHGREDAILMALELSVDHYV